MDTQNLPTVAEPIAGPLAAPPIAIEDRRDRLPTRPLDQRLVVKITGRGGPHILPNGFTVGGAREWTVESWIFESQLPILQALAQDPETEEVERSARVIFARKISRAVLDLLKAYLPDSAEARADKIAPDALRDLLAEYDSMTVSARSAVATDRPRDLREAVFSVLNKTPLSIQGLMWTEHECHMRPFLRLEVLGRLPPEVDPRQEREAMMFRPLIEQNSQLIDLLTRDAIAKKGK